MPNQNAPREKVSFGTCIAGPALQRKVNLYYGMEFVQALVIL